MALTAILFLPAGCGNRAPEPAPIVAMVGSGGITLNELRTVFLEAEGEGPMDENDEAVKELKRNLLNQLIEQRLFLSEAARLKLTVTDDEIKQAFERIREDYTPKEFEEMLKTRQITQEDWKERLRREMLAQKVITKSIPETITIPDTEIQAYYREHRKEFVRPEEIRARQLVVGSPEKARDLLDQLQKGADFAKLAEAHSLSPDKEQGGDLGFFHKGEMPEEFDLVFTLGINQISPIVKTAYGYHIFQTTERRPFKAMSSTEAAERIRAQLTQERREALFTAWVSQLKEKTRITINDQVLYQPVGASGKSTKIGGE
ncbi:MAG TPA: peptidyl-prolyl cis-trans isomerase [Nitrospiria bacterium]